MTPKLTRRAFLGGLAAAGAGLGLLSLFKGGPGAPAPAPRTTLSWTTADGRTHRRVFGARGPSR